MRSFRKPSPAELAFPAIIGVLLAAAWVFRDPLHAVFSSPERVRAFVGEAGPRGVWVFIGLQALQVVVFVIPGEIAQIAGGWLYGVPRGALYSAAGITLGSLANFTLARAAGRRFIAALFGVRALDRFDALSRSERAAAAFFLLFVVPGIPKDALCYAAGLSTMRLRTFMAVSLLGRLPGIVGSALIGGAASAGRYGLAAAVGGIAALLFVLGVVLRERVHGVVGRFVRRPEPINGEGAPRREEA